MIKKLEDDMKNFDKSVPFDPGYSKISFSFSQHISNITHTYNKLRASHQKKFLLAQIESPILDLIEKSAAFYLGCMLWGAFIHYRFKHAPNIIEGNNTIGLSKHALQELDCAAEAKLILEYIQNFDRDCKYLLNRPCKISPFIKEILNNYIEFAKLNNNFIKIKKTNEIKLPQDLSHFSDYKNDQLDSLCDKIYSIIDSGKIESLLKLGFYKI